MSEDETLERGWELYREQKYDAAIAELQQAIGGSDPALAHWRLGFCYRRSGRPERALEHFARAAELAPHDASTHRELGLQTAQLGDLQGALPHFARSLERNPEHPQTFHDTAACLAQLNYFELAAICYTMCGILCEIFNDHGVSLDRYLQSIQQLRRVLGAKRFEEIRQETFRRMGIEGEGDEMRIPVDAARRATDEIVLPPLRQIAGI